MSKHARIFVAEMIGTMILILGGPGSAIFSHFVGVEHRSAWASPSPSA